MPRFRYWTNLPFVAGCCAYLLNRCVIKPRIPSGFFHTHFDDLWLIPCALPPLLWLHHLCGMRDRNSVPTWAEIASHLLFWSFFLEWLGPLLVPRSVGDPWDVAAYATGALASGLWWHRHTFMPGTPKS
ncbi:MAG: hypothetical protein JWO94_915 [Verrucomicrobiaceae bacterium]|nr:hypothetical protein [Verrucomicrobiaceae bacterium]